MWLDPLCPAVRIVLRQSVVLTKYNNFTCTVCEYINTVQCTYVCTYVCIHACVHVCVFA